MLIVFLLFLLFIFFQNGNVFLIFFLSFAFIFLLPHKNKSMNPKSCIFPSISMDNGTAMVPYDFDNPIFHADKDCEEYCELPEELARLLRQESKVIQSHQESVEVINLGTEEDPKGVRIGSALREYIKEKLIKLLQEYMDMFAWSYQDMPGLNTDIVEQR